MAEGLTGAGGLPFRALAVVVVLAIGARAHRRRPHRRGPRYRRGPCSYPRNERSSAAGGAIAHNREPHLRVNWPCAGCFVYVPSTYNPKRPAALLVVLHGDEGVASLIASTWEPAAQRHNVILFAAMSDK